VRLLFAAFEAQLPTVAHRLMSVNSMGQHTLRIDLFSGRL
jgi:hypothetical protein